ATHADDLLHKKGKGAARAAGHAQQLLPRGIRTPWLVDEAERVMVWRFLSSNYTGAVIQTERDPSLTDDPVLLACAVGLVRGVACNGQSYASVSKHGLGRLRQRGGARSEDEMGQAVLALHDDIGRMSGEFLLQRLTRALPEKRLLFPANGGAWGL